jgi:hypothetical protein
MAIDDGFGREDRSGSTVKTLDLRYAYVFSVLYHIYLEKNSWTQSSVKFPSSYPFCWTAGSGRGGGRTN